VRKVGIPRLLKANALARQSQRLRSHGRHHYRRVSVLAACGALILAATGTLAAISWTPPHASPVEAVDMLFVQHLRQAQAPAPTKPQVQVGVTGQLVLMQAAQRAAGEHAAAVAAARAARAAEARAAAERAVAQRAAERAAKEAAEQAVTIQADATQQGAQQPPGEVSGLGTPAVQAPSGSAQEIAKQLLTQYGWAGQFSCLDSLWERESGWNPAAENPSSGAYGIPQALPASKMASAGADWRTDAATQIRWGLSYIKSTYGSPCGAWAHEVSDGWY
jgi:hypothetical protein